MNISKNDRTARVSRRLLLLPLILLVAACGGGDNGGGNMMPTACIDFTGGATATSGSVIAQKGTGSTCDVVVVDLIVTDVNNLFGMEVILTYDPAVVDYESSSSAGSVLTQGGVVVPVLESEVTGQVLIAATRQAANGVNVTGSGQLLRLLFRKVGGSGMSAMSYSGNQLFDDQPPPQPIPGISWSSGQLVVQ